MINSVVLSGRIGKDLEVKTTPSGVPVLTFGLAVTRPQSSESRQAGEDPVTDWFNCVIWRGLANYVGTHGKKGGRVEVRGRLQSRKYTGQDGTERSVVEVLVEDATVIDYKEWEGAG
ncbi:MAG: single-stranded DNA-binding protein [Capsulimonadaceae bacterium]|nr:single-stranded DNA-binding protein [Capsulimonadaceae bacterium]